MAEQRVELRPLTELVAAVLLSLTCALCGLVALAIDVVRLGVRRVYRPVSRTVPPGVVTAKQFGTHEYVTLPSQIKLHCVVNGSRDRPLMIFVHGFPEFWFSWRHQLVEFSKDFRTVAFDLRGYGESSKPKDISLHTRDRIIEDIDQLITSLGYDSCVLVGHDWGGVLAWDFAAVHPDRVSRLVAINAPVASAFEKHLYSSWSQLRKFWYFYVLVIPVVGEFWVCAGDMFKMVDAFVGKWAGAKSGTFTDEDLEAYKFTYRNYDALRSALRLHRAFVLYKSPHVETALRRAKIAVKSLLIWGTGDTILERQLANLSADYCTDVTIRWLDGSSHWVQQEEPDKVNSLIREFIGDI